MNANNSSELDFVADHSLEECETRLQALQEPLNALHLLGKKQLNVVTKQIDANTCQFWLSYSSKSILGRSGFSSLGNISGSLVKANDQQTQVQMSIPRQGNNQYILYQVAAIIISIGMIVLLYRENVATICLVSIGILGIGFGLEFFQLTSQETKLVNLVKETLSKP